MQYADDTIFLIQDDEESAKNLKFILCLFEHLSGLKINFHKSEVHCVGLAVGKQALYEDIFTCKSGKLPLRYLGIPVDRKKVSNIDWRPVEDKFENKLGGWQGKMLSLEGRLVLINFSLSSLPFYMMSFYKLPVGVGRKMDRFRSRFLWSSDVGTKKYHLVSWPVVCLPKSQGGLEVLDLKSMNLALLGKWL